MLALERRFPWPRSLRRNASASKCRGAFRIDSRICCRGAVDRSFWVARNWTQRSLESAKLGAAGGSKLISPKSITIHEHKRPSVPVVVPDLLGGAIEVKRIANDLVGRPIYDIDAAHVGLPSGAARREMLVRVLDPLIELVPGLVFRRLRGRIASLPERFPVGFSRFLPLKFPDLIDFLLCRDIAEDIQ